MVQGICKSVKKKKNNYFYLWISGCSKGLVVESLIPHESRIHGNNDKNKRNNIIEDWIYCAGGSRFRR